MPNHNIDHPDTPDEIGRLCLYSITIISSLLLLVLHKGLEAEWSVLTSTAVICSAYSMIIGGSAIFCLLINGARSTRMIWIAGGILVLLGILAWHTGSAYRADLHLDSGSIFMPYILCLVLGLFILTPFIQVTRDGFETLGYARLYQLSWDNALTILTAIVFTIAGWLLLHLFAGLFSILGIRFFDQLFEQLEFIYPVTGLLIGFGIGIGRSQIGAIRSALNVCLSIARPLLPLISAIAVIFLLALAFNNLDKLWETGTATTLLLCLVVGTVTLLNAVYQDGVSQSPYSKSLQMLIGVALLTLPLFSAIAAYAVYLRVDQYGWSVDRLYAALFTGITSLYALGYAVSYLYSVFNVSGSLISISRVNTVMALALSVALLGTQSPLLDLRKITVQNQLARLELNELSLGKLDLNYFRFQLGTIGYQTLLDFKNLDKTETPADFHARLDEVLAAENRFQAPGKHDQLIADIEAGIIQILPTQAKLPEGLIRYLQSADTAGFSYDRSQHNCKDKGNCQYFINVNLSRHSENEWVLLNTGNYSCRAPVFSQASGNWLLAGHMTSTGRCDVLLSQQALKARDINPVPPAFNDLKVGTQLLHFQPSPKVP